jgi:hypothetical protein
MRMRLLILAMLPLVVSACALPEGRGARQCISDTAICYFPDDPNAPADPYRRR